MEEAELANKTFIDVNGIKLFEARGAGAYRTLKRSSTFQTEKINLEMKCKAGKCSLGQVG